MENDGVTEVSIYAGQGSIELDEHTLEGFEGTIADVLKARGQTVEHTTFLLDHAGDLCPLLAEAFPGLRRVKVYRAKNTVDGGGHDLYKVFGPEA